MDAICSTGSTNAPFIFREILYTYPKIEKLSFGAINWQHHQEKINHISALRMVLLIGYISSELATASCSSQ
jgi:hypothetical protein